jgi:putative zinc finger/helix-turn-helix YgiT family protein
MKGEKMKLLRKEKRYCPRCTDNHVVKIVSQTKRAVIKGVEFNYEAEALYCDTNDSYAVDAEMAGRNDTAMKDAYRAEIGLLTSEDIIEMRKRYGISQRDLSVVLSWGLKTITRYESHQIQDAAHDAILRKLDSDPEWFLELLDKNRDGLSENAYEKYRKAILKRYASLADEYMRKAIAAKELAE